MKTWRTLAVGVACFSSSTAFLRAEVEFSIIPVSASGSYTIAGNEITLDHPGQVVIFEIEVSDWDPDETGILVIMYGVIVDSSGYTSGLRGALTPYRPACETHADCAAAVGTGSLCGGCNCQSGFIDFAHPRYIFKGLTVLVGMDQCVPLDFRWGVVVNPIYDPPAWLERCVGGIGPGDVCFSDADCPGFEDVVAPGTCEIDHGSRYLGSLALEVSPDAYGTFTITFTDYSLFDERGAIIGDSPIPHPAMINVRCSSAVSCNDKDACTDDTCDSGTCRHIRNFNRFFSCCDPLEGSVCAIQTGLSGDTDGDEDVDLADVARMQLCFGDLHNGVSPCAGVDLACDCRVQSADYQAFEPAITGPIAP